MSTISRQFIVLAILQWSCGTVFGQHISIHQISTDSRKNDGSNSDCKINCEPASTHFYKTYSSSSLMDSTVVEIDNSKIPPDENIDTSIDYVDIETGKFPPRNDRIFIPDPYLQFLIAKYTSLPTLPISSQSAGFDHPYTKDEYSFGASSDVRPRYIGRRKRSAFGDYKVYLVKERPVARDKQKNLKLRDVEVFDKSLLNAQGSQKHGGNYRAAPAYHEEDYGEEDYD